MTSSARLIQGYLLVVLLAAGPVLYGQAAGKRSAHAHEHGSGKLDIGMEKLTGEIEWEIPLESITGFEHDAKSAADQKVLATAIGTLKTKFPEMVLLPAASACRIAVQDVKVEREHGDHSELHLRASVTCAQPLAGDVRFAFQRYFPGVHKTAVQFVGDSGQSGAEINNDKGVLKIAR